MKLIGRILIILLAASIVAGITYGITRASGGGSFPGPAGEEGGRLHNSTRSVTIGDEGFGPGEGRPQRGDFDHDEFHKGGGRPGGGFFTTIKNLGIIGAISAVVIAIGLIVDRVKRARRQRRAVQVAAESLT